MSEFRKDPINGGWVIIAEERSTRPMETSRDASQAVRCPFCYGSESETPPELTAIRPDGSAPNEPGWEMRVVPNRYAALQSETLSREQPDPIFHTMNGVGDHEVIIETPDHNVRIRDYPLAKLRSVLQMYRDRKLALYHDPRFKYIQVFKNCGAAAGASQPHPHSQIIAVPMVPDWLRTELACAQEHFAVHGQCLLCTMLARELTDGSRVVAKNAQFVALCPFASRHPYEMLIFPRRHDHDYIACSDPEFEQLAELMLRLFWALDHTLGEPPFNYLFHSAPDILHRSERFEQIENSFHWHIEILPRLSHMAGFEFGTGIHVNSLAPERAAQVLRTALEHYPKSR